VYAYELSKASQLDLLEELGLPYPRARAINDPTLALKAAKDLRYPVLVKANIGGSGAGIVRYETEAALAGAIDRGEVELGIDGVALVQESAPLRNGHIVRVETLGGKYLYAIKVFPAAGSFDLCPADACQTAEGVELVRGACAVDAPKTGLRVEGYDAPRAIIEQVEAISRRAGLDVGGIEYLVDDRDGKHYFYDVNALSNFVADPVNVIGFDPWAKLVDYLVSRSAPARRATERNKERTTFQASLP
jgi:biotin carboxylase